MKARITISDSEAVCRGSDHTISSCRGDFWTAIETIEALHKKAALNPALSVTVNTANTSDGGHGLVGKFAWAVRTPNTQIS